jgi:hypothetical protein
MLLLCFRLHIDLSLAPILSDCSRFSARGFPVTVEKLHQKLRCGGLYWRLAGLVLGSLPAPDLLGRSPQGQMINGGISVKPVLSSSQPGRTPMGKLIVTEAMNGK